MESKVEIVMSESEVTSLEYINRADYGKTDRAALSELIIEKISGSDLPPSELPCPECGDALVSAEIAGQTADICRICRGIWFDNCELVAFSGFSRDLPSRRFRLRSRASRFCCPVCG